MREERKLRVFENRVPGKIFGPKRDEVTGEWRMHNEELNDLYCSQNIFMYVPCILLSLLFRPSNAQRIYERYKNALLIYTVCVGWSM